MLRYRKLITCAACLSAVMLTSQAQADVICIFTLTNAAFVSWGDVNAGVTNTTYNYNGAFGQ